MERARTTITAMMFGNSFSPSVRLSVRICMSNHLSFKFLPCHMKWQSNPNLALALAQLLRLTAHAGLEEISSVTLHKVLVEAEVLVEEVAEAEVIDDYICCI
jgi:hypothetical protein